MTSSLTGQRLGNYEIGPLVGAGGMGQVYRAHDEKLHRSVAIKVLLPAVATDSERLARFNREAQVLASLNHPNIAHIHGVEQGPDGPLLVLEFVDGPTLADRIANRALPVDESIAIARQIADALEAAHERGVIHRDLKPANIKVSDDGVVKILDFGLAKALDPQTGDPGSLAHSPTITSPAMTQAGIILGTAAYMSPEQAKGRVVDKRTDVWAFGCVLFEMITGKRAFEGEDVTETIAAVVRGEPDWAALPANTPAQIRLLLKRSLEKDRRARISDIGVARFLLNEKLDNDAPAQPLAAAKSPRPAAVLAVVGLIVGAAVVAAAWAALTERTDAVAATAVRFEYTPPATQPLVLQGNDHDLAIAPDGSYVVYRSGRVDVTQSRLMIRMLNETNAREIPGTSNARNPFVSPDGRWIAYFVGPELRRVSVGGGAPMPISRVGGAPRGASWGDDGYIVFATGDSNGLYRVAASGGDPQVLLAANAERREQMVNPHVLPGSKNVLFTSFMGSDYLGVSVQALDVATGARKTVLSGAADPFFIVPGYLAYATVNSPNDAQARFGAALRVIRFDPAKTATDGDPVTVADPIMMGTTGAANYSASRRGDLVYLPGSLGTGGVGARPRTLVWVDRKGGETPIDAPPRAYAVPRLSPDGTRIALDVRDQTNDIWIWDINRHALSLLNRDNGQDMSPNWTADSKKVIWTSTRSGGNPNLFSMAADGSGVPESLTTQAGMQFPTSLTPDGRTALVFGAGGTLTDIYVVNFDEPGRKQKPLIALPSAAEFDAEISPDGKWVAYHSNESGEFQVYVRPFPNVDARRSQVSTNGGTRAAWTRNGHELTYLSKDGDMMSVTVQTAGGAFSAAPPVRLFKSPYLVGASILGLDLRGYDVTPDGQRFVMIKQPDNAGTTSLTGMIVVLNLISELKEHLPIP